MGEVYAFRFARPGEHLCPHPIDSPYRDAWLDGFAAAQSEFVAKRIAAIEARQQGEG